MPQTHQALAEAGDHPPVIGVTAATIGSERQELIDAGATAALTKPLDLEALMKLIVQLFENE